MPNRVYARFFRNWVSHSILQIFVRFWILFSKILHLSVWGETASSHYNVSGSMAVKKYFWLMVLAADDLWCVTESTSNKNEAKQHLHAWRNEYCQGVKMKEGIKVWWTTMVKQHSRDSGKGNKTYSSVLLTPGDQSRGKYGFSFRICCDFCGEISVFYMSNLWDVAKGNLNFSFAIETHEMRWFDWQQLFKR